MADLNNSPFKVIRGGLSETPETSKKAFVSAYVTDTRLMGVVGVYAHWKLTDNETYTDFHQFFYFDAEEYGFDTYNGLVSGGDEETQPNELKDIENSLLGGLGGRKIKLTEKEVRYLVQEYSALNRRMQLPLPEGLSEYEFLLLPEAEVDPTEKYILMSKQCSILTTPYQVINYFLMRCYAKDFGAAKFLTKNYVRTNIFSEHKAATLYKNTIDEATDSESGSNSDYYFTDRDKDFGTFNTHKSYLCESLIEYDDSYYLIVTQVTLDHLRVVKFDKVSSFKVSDAEASMMLARPEYVTVFDVFEGAPVFTQKSTKLVETAMLTTHEAGQLFMIFYPHNDHVNKKVFLLNEDVLGVYLVTEYGQLIISSFSLEGIQALEKDLTDSPYGAYTEPVSKYQFKEPILYDFLSSEFEDFEDFVDYIADEDYPEGGGPHVPDGHGPDDHQPDGGDDEPF